MMEAGVDPFDPNLWEDWPSHVRSSNSEHMALVDYEDWLFVCNWVWRFKPSKGQTLLGSGYLCRSAWIYPVGAPRFSTSLYLHVEIMKRVEPPPSIFHTQVDHIDRDRMNCTRTNLRWSTVVENNRNKTLPPRVGGKWTRKEAP